MQPKTNTVNNAKYIKWATFLSGLAFYTPIAPLYFLSKGVGLPLIVLSQAVYSIAIILSEVPTGILADKFGNRKSVILGGLCEVVGIASLLIFPNVYGLFIGYILMGIGAAFQSGSTEALLYEGAKSQGKRREYKKHLSQVLSNDTLAFAVGTAIVGLAYGARGTTIIPILIGCSLVAKFAGFLVTLKLTEVEGAGEYVKDKNMWQTFRESIGYIKADSTLVNLTYVKVLTLTAQYVVLSSYQSYFVSNGVSAYFVGFVLSIGGLANAICMRQVHRLEKYLSLDKVVLWLTLAMGVTYLIFSFVHTPALLVIVFVLLQAQFNLQDPIVSDYINDRTSSGIRATVLSGISLIRNLGNTASKIILGLAIAGVGVGGMLRIQAAYLVVGSFVSYWLLVRCGCIYKLSDDSTEGGDIQELEAEVDASR